MLLLGLHGHELFEQLVIPQVHHTVHVVLEWCQLHEVPHHVAPLAEPDLTRGLKTSNVFSDIMNLSDVID